LLWLAGALLGLLVVATVVFMKTLDLAPVDAIYFVVTTATTTGYGDISLHRAPAWLKMFGSVLMVSDAVLLAILISHLAAYLTTDRIEERMGRRAARMTHHAVIAGLGNVGYRAQRIFHRLAIPTVVIERSNSVRFVEAVRENSVVLIGDGSLPEALEAASIERARYFLAVTDDDMTNIQATLQARRQNPAIRTVTRIMNPHLAELLPRGFSVDVVLNPTVVSADAFVGAATDQRAPRSFSVAGQPWIALHWRLEAELTVEEREAWSAAGIQVVATEEADGSLVAARRASALPGGTHMVVAGPAAAIEARLELRPVPGSEPPD
jgi:Trk K+ transport system NAD-binding subunit